MAIYELHGLNAQAGYYDTVGQVWTEIDLISGILGVASPIGMIFDRDITENLELERSLRLDPVQVRKMVLTLIVSGTPNPILAGPPPWSFPTKIWFINEQNVPKYNTTLYPTNRPNEELILDTTITVNAVGDIISLTILPDYTQTILTPGQDKLRAYMLSQGSKTLALSLSFTMATNFSLSWKDENDPVEANHPKITATLVGAFHTGHDLGSGHRGRARHDPRSGLPIATGDLIDDGWTEGLRVSPD